MAQGINKQLPLPDARKNAYNSRTGFDIPMPKKYSRRRKKQAPGLFEQIFLALSELAWQMIAFPFAAVNRKLGRFIRHKILPSAGKTQKTLRGETVKSTAEKRIANYLHKKGIDYVYEPKLRVWLFKTVRPDFYLPGHDLYIEYFGLLNHPAKKKRYRREVAYKKRRYYKLGINVLYLDHRHRERLEREVARGVKWKTAKEK